MREQMEIGSYFSNIKGLPTVPAILPKLLSVLTDLDVVVDDIVDILKLDMSLSAQIIRLSNSSYFSFGKPSSDLKEAVSRIGMEETYKLVSSLIGIEFINLDLPGDHVDRESIWESSIGCAVGMDILAKKCALNPVTAYSIGLFHNLGMIVINQMMGEQYRSVLKKAEEEGIAVRDAELEILGFNFVAVSSTLLQYWKFIPEITEPIYYQFSPVHCKNYTAYADMLHLSLKVMMDEGIIEGDYAVTDESAAASAFRLGIVEGYLPILGEEINSGIININSMLRG
jgi:HD-like signal output (HDOD) protein